MLNKVNVSKDGKVCFVLADDLEPEDFVGKYVYPYADLLINIYLENVQLRDNFEDKVYEELLPFQRFCVDQYKSMKDRVVNYIEFNQIGYGYGFIIYDPTNDTRAVTLHEWIRDNVDGTAWHYVLFSSDILFRGHLRIILFPQTCEFRILVVS